ncbi:quinon protein alcohol dehydrogenase-like superfamily [Infundibulicybe gibba]|nr:quinon protein alcohol dehydrogenase-like superfamily [Infundibulicybe gibba]
MSHVCDTIPPAKLAPSSSSSSVAVAAPSPKPAKVITTPMISPSSPPPRKLCVRHQRMADEGTSMRLQQSLDALPVEERSSVSAVWSNFSSSSHPRRALILHGLLTMCCFSQLSLLSEQLAHLIRIDPFTILPHEVSLKILGYLDAISLCRAAQVTRRWKALADDNTLWRGICEQHIGQKCGKCGWGLPVLSRPCQKRPIDDPQPPPSPKRHRHSPPPSELDSASISSLLAPNPTFHNSITRPWKDVYSERMTVERNWRRGRCTVRTFKGHTDGVMCLQFNEHLSHPAFPVLITGSYDRTVRVWNLETGAELHCLRGHSRAVRALQFDDAKLITGSMDSTLRVWDWRRGTCIRTLHGHTEGVVCLNFDSNVLASGSVDSTIKVWNLRTGGAFTLRGHCDWVNAVQLWDSIPGAPVSPTNSPIFDIPSCSAPPQIDPGKMLFSASDDGTIKLWDLTLRTCIRKFTGHVGQVQSMRLLLLDTTDDAHPTTPPSASPSPIPSADPDPAPHRTQPVLISGSLDNTIKIWDIDTGATVRTFFGHIEGVWAVASDKLRLVSGSHDRTIKVWSREEGKCTSTLVGHQAAVSCLALGEDKIISGSDDWDVKVWSFSG